MKQKKHLLKKIIMFGLVFILLSSCEKDLYDDYLSSNKHSLLVQRKNFEDLKQDKVLMKSIEKFTLRGKNSLNRQHFDTINNFYIDLDNVMFTLDSLNNQTYTFKVNRIPDNGLFENLILKSSQTGDFDAVLAQYNQNLINLTSTSPQDIENAINQYATFTYLGKKTIAEINNKFSINEECFEPGYIYVQGDQCASGNHSFSEGSACTYWGSMNMATTGGYVFTMVPTKCDGGSEGATPPTNGSFSTGPHLGGGAEPNVQLDPCAKLKNLFNPAKANIKPFIINDLRPNIAVNPSGEKGLALAQNSAGALASNIIPPVPLPPLPIPTSGDFYSAIHTQPLDTYPMFSWSDVVVLNSLNNNCNNLATHNTDMASFLLVCQDDNNDFQTYAIVFDPISSNQTINQFMNNPENVGCSSQEISEIMDKKLGLEYGNDSNYERVFLNFMSNSNVSLYKANSSLTNWSKLTLSNNSPTATVNSTKCK